GGQRRRGGRGLLLFGSELFKSGSQGRDRLLGSGSALKETPTWNAGDGYDQLTTGSCSLSDMAMRLADGGRHSHPAIQEGLLETDLALCVFVCVFVSVSVFPRCAPGRFVMFGFLQRAAA